MTRTVAISAFAFGLSVFAGVLVGPAQAQVRSFTTSYTGCGSSYAIRGQEPDVAGTFPVFIYTVGTSEDFEHASALAAVSEMAQRGYVAATVDYPNGSFGGCSTLSGRAECIHAENRANSAASVLCARAKADCGKGIVVAGFSQGSIMAILANDYNSQVRAAYGLGAGVEYSFYDLRACVADGNRALPSSRLRAINGEDDFFFGGTESSVRDTLRELTGYGCYFTNTCFAGNGSGWYVIENLEVDDNTADHCYMRNNGCSGSTLDAIWRSGSEPWSLQTNLNWLTGFTD